MPNPSSSYFARRRPSLGENLLSGQMRAAAYVADWLQQCYILTPAGGTLNMQVPITQPQSDGTFVVTGNAPVTDNRTGLNDKIVGLRDHFYRTLHLRNTFEYDRKHS